MACRKQGWQILVKHCSLFTYSQPFQSWSAECNPTWCLWLIAFSHTFPNQFPSLLFFLSDTALPLKMSPLISAYLRWSSHLTETSEFTAGWCIRPWWNYLESVERGRRGADDSSSRKGSSTLVQVTNKRKLHNHQIFNSDRNFAQRQSEVECLSSGH